MHGRIPVAAATARDRAPASGSHEKFTPGTGCEERDWLFEAACEICGRRDPGYQLHLFTGWPLSSCRYYVAREPAQRRKPPGEFLHDLFRSRHGEPFFRACMANSDAPWFADLLAADQRARDAEARLAAIADLLARG